MLYNGECLAHHCYDHCAWIYFGFKAFRHSIRYCFAWLTWQCQQLYRRARYNGAHLAYNYQRLLYYYRVISRILHRLPAISLKFSLLPLVVMCGFLGEEHNSENPEPPTPLTSPALLSPAVTIDFVQPRPCDRCCQRCTSPRRPRQLFSKSAGSSIQFRMALAYLIENRLNPRATPFIPAVTSRRNRWHYVADPVTKHLRLPASSIASTYRKKRQSPRKPRYASKHVPLTNAGSPRSLPISTSSSPVPLAELRAVTIHPATYKTINGSPSHRVRTHRSYHPRTSQGRHRRHRRHRKNTLRGLPTPASSLYSRPKNPAPLLLHEGVAHELEDHG
jgi:hypothetical protein